MPYEDEYSQITPCYVVPANSPVHRTLTTEKLGFK